MIVIERCRRQGSHAHPLADSGPMSAHNHHTTMEGTSVLLQRNIGRIVSTSDIGKRGQKGHKVLIRA
jgi:hypothetical protein